VHAWILIAKHAALQYHKPAPLEMKKLHSESRVEGGYHDFLISLTKSCSWVNADGCTSIKLRAVIKHQYINTVELAPACMILGSVEATRLHQDLQEIAVFLPV
jgi:hypothetical protein